MSRKAAKLSMSLNTVPTNYHEFEYSKFFLFKLKFMNAGRIHAERCWGLRVRAIARAAAGGRELGEEGVQRGVRLGERGRVGEDHRAPGRRSSGK